MSRRPSAVNGVPASSPSTAYGLALLSEYTHTLDSVPVDLSRSFGDLRELDAVLSSSITLLTAKINELIVMIETKTGTNDDRLFLLTEIAEEAGRLKLGGEDKIRVACHAADGLRAHKAHMKALLDLIPDQEFAKAAEALSRKTVYPHVATRNFYPPGMTGEGRRNRRAAGATTGYNALYGNGVEASPGKRKRVGRDEDIDPTRTPTKKDRAEAQPGQKPRNGARPKRTADRVASPTESIMSVASHLPQNLPAPSSTSNGRQNASGRAGSSSSANKRNQGESTSSRRDAFSAQPPSSSHPSLPAPFPASNTGLLLEPHGTRATSNGVIPEWPHGQLEGPGMPVARNIAAAPIEGNDGTLSAAEPDGDADDGKTYCFCDGVSYGEMIACDDEECEKEWFHIACVGLTVVPDDTWYCARCLEKRQNQKKTGRGGKKRTTGGRTARNHGA
ncbi:hypothetical protein GY45DRAFT_1367880 [Cubamyces sp. BRFM 1775]|nr:hypothetical protein GY45DRAFT_1367880 [Cubamyces sp. BRFM 1775]